MAVRYSLRTLNGIRREIPHVRPQVLLEPAGERQQRNRPEAPRFFRGQREARALGLNPANREPDPEPVYTYHTRHWWQMDPHRCQGWKRSSGTTPVQCSRRLPARGGAFCFQHTAQRRAGSAVLAERHTQAEELRATRMREQVADAQREHRALVIARRRITEGRDHQEQLRHSKLRHPHLERLKYERIENDLTGGPVDQPLLDATKQEVWDVFTLPKRYRRASFPCRSLLALTDKQDRQANRRQGKFQDLRDRQLDTMSLYDRCNPDNADCDDEEDDHLHRVQMLIKCNICRRFSPPRRHTDYTAMFPESWVIPCGGCGVRVHRHCQQTVEPWHAHHLYRCTFCLGYVYDDVNSDSDSDSSDVTSDEDC